MRKLLPALAFLALSVFWACHLNEGENEDRFNLVGDESWLACDEVTVALLDKDGKEIDVLFKGHLNSLDDLKGLSAEKYDGTSGAIHISGTKGGASCFEEKRSFEGDGSKLKIDTIKSPTALPTSVVVEPDSISIPLGSSGVPVKASVKPSYVDQGLDWRVAPDGIVSIPKPAGAGNQAMIIPAKLGSTQVRVVSVKDSTKSGILKVTVTPPSELSLTLDKDSVIVYLGGGSESLKATVLPSTADQKVTWKSLEANVVSVDSNGIVKGLREGETYVQATSAANNLSASAHVQVKRDAPKLEIASKPGAPVNQTITFTPKATQQYGTLTVFKWDLDGDGAFEDSATTGWSGKEVDLPPQSAKFTKEGPVTVGFLVRDSEGNETIAKVNLDIGNQAPEIYALSNDTSVSIKDSVPFKASVRDVDGKVAWIGFDYEGDGVYDDSTSPGADSAKIAFSHRYPDANPQYKAILKATDETGKSRFDTVLVRVELDRPKVNLGNDTTVTVGSKVPVRVGATDKYGKILKREVRLHGSGAGFITLSGEDTVFTAPNEPGSYLVVGRATDDDGLADVDSLTVTVVLSANADLSNLAISAGTLDPAFKPAISFFTAQVPYTDSMVSVTPTAKDEGAKITVNAKPVASGSASEAVKLAVGSNTNAFQIIVTAADGTQRIYTLSVARNPSADATLSKLDGTGFILKPAFASTTLDYADTVGSLVASITLKPTLSVPTATLTLNGESMTSGTATQPLALALGENVYKLVVTSQSGANKTTYTVKVFRKAQLFVLRSLDGKPGTQIDSAEAAPGVARPLSSDPVTGYRFVKWTLLEGTGTLKDSLANPTEITLASAKVRAQANYVLNTYVIKASGNAGGSISPSGDVTVGHGADQAFTITVLPGNRLRGLTVDGANGIAGLVNGVYTFKAVSADHSISADFVKVDTLTATTGPGGTVTPAKILADRGSDTAFIVAGNPDFKISTFTDNGVDKRASIDSKGRYPIKADGNHAIAATWIQGLLMKGVAGAGGSITPDSVVVDAGTDMVWTVDASNGYRVEKLLDNGLDSTNAKSFAGGKYSLPKVQAKHTITVTFKRQYNIAVTVKGPGSVTGTAGIVDSGLSRTFTLVYDKDVKVKSLLVDGNPSNLTTIPFDAIKADHSINVEFVRTYFFSTTWSAGGIANAGGSISPANPTLDSNSSVEFTIAPAPNYRTDTLKVDGTPIAPATTKVPFANIDKGHTVQAKFKRTFSIKSAVGLGLGVITPTSKTVDTLEALKMSFSPSTGYRFDKLTDFGKTVLSTPGSVEYPMGAVVGDHDFSVQFWKQYAMSETHTGKGKVDFYTWAPDSLGIDTAYIQPAAGYKITSIRDNGNAVNFADGTKLTKVPFSGIKEDHKLEIVFTAFYTIEAASSNIALGTVSPLSSTVDSNGSVTIMIKPNANAVVKYVTDNGKDIVGPILSYTLSGVSEKHSIMVNFTEGKTYTVGVGAILEKANPDESLSGEVVCIAAGKSEYSCGPAPFSVALPIDTPFSLFGRDATVCNGAGCFQDAGVNGWDILVGREWVPVSETNPTEIFKPANATVGYRARYVKGIFQ